MNKAVEPTLFLEAEIDLSFAFLHLAEYAICAGNTACAGDLIANASVGYKSVLACLDSLSLELEEERRLQSLQRGVGKIFQAMTNGATIPPGLRALR